MSSMTIGNIAKLADVGVETIRFYERQGLIEKPPRLASGYRQYSEDTVQGVHFIRRGPGFLRSGSAPGLGQRLGFACFFLWAALVGFGIACSRAHTDAV